MSLDKGLPPVPEQSYGSVPYHISADDKKGGQGAFQLDEMKSLWIRGPTFPEQQKPIWGKIPITSKLFCLGFVKAAQSVGFTDYFLAEMGAIGVAVWHSSSKEAGKRLPSYPKWRFQAIGEIDQMLVPKIRKSVDEAAKKLDYLAPGHVASLTVQRELTDRFYDKNFTKSSGFSLACCFCEKECGYLYYSNFTVLFCDPDGKDPINDLLTVSVPKCTSVTCSKNAERVREAVLSEVYGLVIGGRIPRFANVDTSVTNRSCGQCAKIGPQTSFRQCSRCKATVYCSKLCQKLNWKAHRGFCRPKTVGVGSGSGAAASGAQKLDEIMQMLELD